jgi:hypothetical protein
MIQQEKDFKFTDLSDIRHHLEYKRKLFVTKDGIPFFCFNEFDLKEDSYTNKFIDMYLEHLNNISKDDLFKCYYGKKKVENISIYDKLKILEFWNDIFVTGYQKDINFHSEIDSTRYEEYCKFHDYEYEQWKRENNVDNKWVEQHYVRNLLK